MPCPGAVGMSHPGCLELVSGFRGHRSPSFLPTLGTKKERDALRVWESGGSQGSVCPASFLPGFCPPFCLLLGACLSGSGPSAAGEWGGRTALRGAWRPRSLALVFRFTWPSRCLGPRAVSLLSDHPRTEARVGWASLLAAPSSASGEQLCWGCLAAPPCRALAALPRVCGPRESCPGLPGF